MMDFNYPAILQLFPEHLDPRRSESAAFLIWYLENYYRLDSQEAVDSVCDQHGDKGIDGIFANDNTQTITVFQAHISQKNTAVGDVKLKEFAGSLKQLQDKDSIQKLLASAGKAEVAALAQRLKIVEKIAAYELRGEFLSNIDVDHNGRAYLQQAPEIAFVGRNHLTTTHISDQRDVAIQAEVQFDVSGFQVTEYTVDADSKALIAPIRAKELVKLDGISNQAIFTHNVRGPLGSTNVNKDIAASGPSRHNLRIRTWVTARNHRRIAASIRDPALHKKFPLFHNGITVIAGSLDPASEERLVISDYFRRY